MRLEIGTKTNGTKPEEVFLTMSINPAIPVGISFISCALTLNNLVSFHNLWYVRPDNTWENMRAFISNRIMKLCNNALNALGVGGPTQGVLILVSLRCGCVRLDDPFGFFALHDLKSFFV